MHVVIVGFQVEGSIPPVLRQAQDERNKNRGEIQHVQYFAENHNTARPEYVAENQNTVRPGDVTENQSTVRPEPVEGRTPKPQIKRLFYYPNIKSEPEENIVSQISPYLIDAPLMIIENRNKPLCDVLPMVNGSKPTDGGNLLLSDDEKLALIKTEPGAEIWIRPFSMVEEFISGERRWYLWLKNCPPNTLRQMPAVMERVEAVRRMRGASTDIQTRKDAAIPTLFQKIRQPKDSYLALPRVSSERRQYIPIGFLPESHIAGDKLQTIPNATLYHFGVLSSAMHMAWMRTTTGRLKSDYQYSALIVYNNFPWPENLSDKQRQTIEAVAQAVLDARAKFPDSSLADLYDPITMPPELVKAHHKLDAAVDAAYAKKKFSGDSDRVAFLFELYQQLISRRN